MSIAGALGGSLPGDGIPRSQGALQGPAWPRGLPLLRLSRCRLLPTQGPEAQKAGSSAGAGVARGLPAAAEASWTPFAASKSTMLGREGGGRPVPFLVLRTWRHKLTPQGRPSGDQSGRDDLPATSMDLAIYPMLQCPPFPVFKMKCRWCVYVCGVGWGMATSTFPPS